MLRAKPDVARVVALLVIPAQGLQPAVALAGINPDTGEQPPRSFDPLHGRALALVLDRLDRKSAAADVVFVTDARHDIMFRAVMRQDAKGVAVTVGPQPFEVRCQGLSDRLVIIDKPEGLARYLRYPDRAGVPDADVPIGPVLQQRVGRNLTDARLFLCLGDVAGEVSTLCDGNVVAVPDMLVLLGLLAKTV